jgi:adenylyl-sulfate kinase
MNFVSVDRTLSTKSPHGIKESSDEPGITTVWLMGLSGSGKSTLAYELDRRLSTRGYPCFVLDGDNVRKGLNRDLGFTRAERSANSRRIAEVAHLFNQAGPLVVAAVVSPYAADRALARSIIRSDRFLEVWLTADAAVCERRDSKGLHAKAKSGWITEFTGVSAPYEIPEGPAAALNTASRTIEECMDEIMRLLKPRTGGKDV